MNTKYSSDEFKNALLKKLNNKLPKCTMCGNDKYILSEDFTSLFSQNDLKSISIGKYVPAGVIICRNCGHIELFALGMLGLNLNIRQEETNRAEEER